MKTHFLRSHDDGSVTLSSKGNEILVFVSITGAIVVTAVNGQLIIIPLNEDAVECRMEKYHDNAKS